VEQLVCLPRRSITITKACNSPVLALPAPIGVLLQFAQARHQAGARDDERVAATLRAQSPQQMEGGGLPQIKQVFDRLAVDAIRNE